MTCRAAKKFRFRVYDISIDNQPVDTGKEIELECKCQAQYLGPNGACEGYCAVDMGRNFLAEFFGFWGRFVPSYQFIWDRANPNDLYSPKISTSGSISYNGQKTWEFKRIV